MNAYYILNMCIEGCAEKKNFALICLIMAVYGRLLWLFLAKY